MLSGEVMRDDMFLQVSKVILQIKRNIPDRMTLMARK
jgi:hypothetical protein